MAKGNYYSGFYGDRYMEEQQKKKSAGKIKKVKGILYGVLAFVVCAVIAFVACYFAIPDFNAWVNNIPNTGSNGVNAENILVSTPDVSDGSPISLLSNESENGEIHTLTATVSPETATYSGVSWTSDNEAVVVVPTGKLTAEVSCIAPFSETAHITCAVIEYPEITTTATVDYLSTANIPVFIASAGSNVSFGANENNNKIEVIKTGYDYDVSIVCLDSARTTGSVKTYFRIHPIRIVLDSRFVSIFNTVMVQSEKPCNVPRIASWGTGAPTGVTTIAPSLNLLCSNTKFGDFEEAEANFKYCFYEAVQRWENSMSEPYATMSVTFNELAPGGVTYKTWEFTFGIAFDKAGFMNSADDVGLDNSDILFGT